MSANTLEQELSFSNEPLTPLQKQTVIAAFGDYGNAAPETALQQISEKLSPEAIETLEGQLTPFQIERYKAYLLNQAAQARTLIKNSQMIGP